LYTWFKKLSQTYIEGCLKIVYFHIFSLQQNLAKSSYGSSLRMDHHLFGYVTKLTKKHTDCKYALNFNIVASDAKDIDVIAVMNRQIVILAITACIRRRSNST
jgi:hypothetical protein